MTRETRLLPVRAMTAPLVLTVFLANGAIMALELVAGALVARYLGQSLYTWTAIIGVILGGMSLGHWAGGRLADRFPSPRLMGWLFFLAALAIVAILLLNRLAGEDLGLAALSWPARIAAHMMVTFFLPAAFLGTINPVAARRALDAGAGAGRTVGRIYAAAAAGSIGGVFLTGFVLVAWWRTTTIVGALAGAMGMLGLAWFFGSRDSIRSRPTGTAQRARMRDWFLPGATVFVSNAAFMVLELAGSRMVTREFGHGLHTWTAILGIVLAGITAGNYLGGRAADQTPPSRLLSMLFVLAAAACLGTLWTHEQLLFLLRPTGLHRVTRLVLHTFGAFFLPSLLLGMIGPAVAKWALARNPEAGRALGAVYAFGAVGSVAGTFLTGYWLVDWLWPSGALLALCLVLTACAVLHGRRSRLAWCAFTLTLLLTTGAVMPSPLAAPLRNALELPGADPSPFIHADHTQYSWLGVRDQSGGKRLRELALDNLVHTEANLDDPLDLRFRFWWIYEGVMALAHPAPMPTSMLMIGGGGYVFPRYVEVARPGSRIEVAEIDPAVTRAARDFFDFPPDSTIQAHDLDGRNLMEDLLRDRAGTFDYVIGDSINRISVPFQLTTVEFTRKVHDLLNDNGLYLLNTTDRFDTGRFTGAIMYTCRQVFANVYACTTRPRNAGQRDTIIIICAKRPLDLDDLAGRIRSVHPSFPGEVLREKEIDQLVARSGPCLLEDNYAPVDNLLSRVGADYENQRYEETERLGLALLGEARRYRDTRIWNMADKDYRRVMEILPLNPEVREEFGETLFKRGQFEAAEGLFEEAAACAPWRAVSYALWGDALMRQGRAEDACAPYQRAYQLEPANPAYREKLIRAQNEMRLVPTYNWNRKAPAP